MVEKNQVIYHQEIPERFQYLVNDPEARFEIRKKFYKKYGLDTNILSIIWRFLLRIFTKNMEMGMSELDFLRWEIERGVLNPLDAEEQMGSRWWRDVNLEFIIISEIAAEIHEGKLPEHPVNNEIQLWLNYLKERTGQSWYRAHNASIVRAYLNCVEQAKEESIYEQTFMNEVLYRVLYAQAMVEDDSPFKELGVFGSSPMSPAVDIMVKIPSFYPDNYPLSEEDIKNVMHKGHGIDGHLERVFDKYLILEHIEALFAQASKWMNIPRLKHFIKSKIPIYPRH